jgi:hypothetical protein
MTVFLLLMFLVLLLLPRRRRSGPIITTHSRPLVSPRVLFLSHLLINSNGRWGDAALDLLTVLSRRVGDLIGEQNKWRSYWSMRISIVARRAVSIALDVRYKKALSFSSTPYSAPNPGLDAERAHLISVPPLGVSGSSFESACSANFV